MKEKSSHTDDSSFFILEKSVTIVVFHYGVHGDSGTTKCIDRKSIRRPVVLSITIIYLAV
jgi:hypothetical protein